MIPGSNWKIRNNKLSDNIAFGILLYDSATANKVENNDCTNNCIMDIELGGYKPAGQSGFGPSVDWPNGASKNNFVNFQLYLNKKSSNALPNWKKKTPN